MEISLNTIHSITDPQEAAIFLKQYRESLEKKGQKNPEVKIYKDIQTAIAGLPGNIRMMWYGVLSSQGYIKAYEKSKDKDSLEQTKEQVIY